MKFKFEKSLDGEFASNLPHSYIPMNSTEPETFDYFLFVVSAPLTYLNKSHFPKNCKPNSNIETLERALKALIPL